MIGNNNSKGDERVIQTGNGTITNKKNGKTQYINFGEEDQMEIQGFASSKLRLRICVTVYCLTLGLLRLFFHWYPYLHLVATHSKAPLSSAEKVLITDKYQGKAKTYFVKTVKVLRSETSTDSGEKSVQKLLKFRLADGRTKELYQIRIIRCKKLSYIWDDEMQRFAKLAGLENGITRSNLHDFGGQTKDEQLRKKIVYGDNEINVPVQTVSTLLLLEALTPFYIFQLFSLIVWLSESYYYYTVALIVMSVFGIATSVIQTRKNQKNLKGTVNRSDRATICRAPGVHDEVSTSELVPGDVIVIPKFGCDVHCDAVLLSGGCIVNESMLTGESVPVAKSPVHNDDTLYNVKEDVNHTLFCGTKVIQTRCQDNEAVTAVVIRTGYLTTKGELVRSILYPPPADFKFDQDSYKYIGILSCIAALGFLYTVVSKISRNIAPLEIAIKALDIITIVIPPALPAAMTVGKLYALNRLKNNKIFCINSRVINVSGSVDCICFDKTGTLTEDNLDMWSVVPVREGEFDAPIKDMRTVTTSLNFLRGMAACHSLSRINGQTCGDPLDVKMFESTGWTFIDNHTGEIKYDSFTPLVVMMSQNPNLGEHQEVAVVKQFQFSSALQRMSVVAKSPTNPHLEVFCKGSPEVIVTLCNATSVPGDIRVKLKQYTEQGYRVIALAFRTLESTEHVFALSRKEAETGLTFLGLIVFENKLKPKTANVVRTLKDADMKVVMITGDNIQTAVTVAKECGIVGVEVTIIEVVVTKPSKFEFASIKYNVVKRAGGKMYSLNGHDYSKVDIEIARERNYCLVMSGQCWGNLVRYFPDMVPKIVAKGVVFARMSGIQKQQLVEELKTLGYYVAMCGDGANDCGALKAAHVGVSLSDAESSVASPFTSKEQDVSCVPEVVKEGRAALVTSFGVFKMMICYSLTEFCSVIILYNIDSNLSSFQFLFIDVVLIMTFASSFGRTKAAATLAKKPPRMSILSFVPVCSIALFMALTVAFQVFAFRHVQTYDWFVAFRYDRLNPYNFYSYEDYAVFGVSMFQYIILAVVFSKGKPYRRPLYTNSVFLLSLIVMTILCAWVVLRPPEFLWKVLELKVPPHWDGRIAILGIASFNFLACYALEELFVEVILGRYVEPKIVKSAKRYEQVLEDLQQTDWPLVEGYEPGAEVKGLVNRAYLEETNEKTKL
ncbi:polyamine-transporting ATPase 13A3-like isoform X2 [Cylas formicarius]|uniref:polyamine-transporting ATPase 13A3-like isoform X2 n=1 Tax=Cylas formicarius TaxID=197179 RepID=UPI0029589AC5|nr:polyamine-transporting ATPase 13A3-like isoform X2 [Cylas formicarius]